MLLPIASAVWAQDARVQQYVLDDTEVRAIHSEELQRDYEVFINLPSNYATSTRSYPVVFVTDANYAFPLMRSISRRVGDHGRNLEDFILVGLSYAKGDTPEYSRRRDYTPSAFGQAARSDMAGREAKFGEAEGYSRFLAKDVLPFIATNYRADMSHKIFAGHSYGSLLGLHILLNEPTMFDYYVLGSPSLWFNHRVMFEREQAYAKTHQDLPAKVYFAAGGFETVNHGSKNPRFSTDDDIVRDMEKFAKVLKSHHYPHLQVQTEVIPDEDHLTVAPTIITRGLLWSLAPKP